MVAVAVCTDSEPTTLVPALEAATAGLPAGGEVLVVRNGPIASRPPSPELAAWLERTPWASRLVAEPEHGVAAAKQAALDSASSDAVAFVDDDTVAHPGWYQALGTALTDGVGAVGGTIEARWPGGRPPRWLHPRLMAAYAVRPSGSGLPPFGPNLALVRAAAVEVGGFRRDLGHRSGRSGLHDETDLCRRIEAAGWQVVDAPGATVDHLVRPDQLRPAWLLRRAWGEGTDDVRRDGRIAAVRAAAYLLASLAVVPVGVVRRDIGVLATYKAVASAAAIVTAVGGGVDRPPPRPPRR